MMFKIYESRQQYTHIIWWNRLKSYFAGGGDTELVYCDFLL